MRSSSPFFCNRVRPLNRPARSSTASWCCCATGCRTWTRSWPVNALTRASAIRHLSQTDPVSYVVFDAPFAQGRCLFGDPLHRRRGALTDVVLDLEEPRLVFSEGLVAIGSVFFETVVAHGHEGAMAKHLASTYAPGQRSASWKKIKPARTLPCAIVGFVPGREGFRHLLVAAPWKGTLHYVATLHHGFTGPVRVQVNALLAGRERRQPVVACPPQTVGVEPDLFCQVRYLDWTRGGHLRGASFQRLLPGPEGPGGGGFGL
jgi:bifunctional non-homologous end joining protein LigD